MRQRPPAPPDLPGNPAAHPSLDDPFLLPEGASNVREVPRLPPE